MQTLEAPLSRWQSLCEEIQQPDVELTVEEFAAMLSVYKLLRSEGHEFDPGTIALMTVLERQAADTLDAFEDDTDPDEDGADEGIDFDDTLEDRGTYSGFWGGEDDDPAGGNITDGPHY